MDETLLPGALFVLATLALIFAVYFGMRLIAARHIGDDTRELANSVIIRITALHGLILALVFAQELLSYQLLKSETVKEANAIANIYNDAVRHGSPAAAEIQAAMSAYVNLVATEEWRQLGDEGTLLGPAWAEWDRAYQAILDLQEDTPRKAALRTNMLAGIHGISESRDLRAAQAIQGIDAMFWFAAVSGLVFASMAYFSFPPKLVNLVLIGMFGAFTGVVLFIIYALSNPFQAPGALSPAAIQRLADGRIGHNG